MKRFAILAAVASVFGIQMQSAHACSPPQCAAARFAVRTLPASAPVLPFMLDTTPNDGAQELMITKVGSAMPIAGRLQGTGTDQAFVPSVPFTPGAYTIRFRSDCMKPEEQRPYYVDSPFDVTAAIALPSVLGSVSVKSAGRDLLQANTSSGSCLEPVDAAHVDFNLALDPGFAPYLDVTAFQTRVDGQHWADTAPGAQIDAPSGPRAALRLFAACDDRSAHPGRDQGLVEGSHLVEIVAKIAGSAQVIAPTRLQVTVACDDSNGAVQELPDAGGSSSGGSSSGGSSSGGSSGAVGTSSSGSSGAATGDRAEPGDAGGGCSTSIPLRGGSSTCASVVMALACILARRRRA